MFWIVTRHLLKQSSKQSQWVICFDFWEVVEPTQTHRQCDRQLWCCYMIMLLLLHFLYPKRLLLLQELIWTPFVLSHYIGCVYALVVVDTSAAVACGKHSRRRRRRRFHYSMLDLQNPLVKWKWKGKIPFLSVEGAKRNSHRHRQRLLESFWWQSVRPPKEACDQQFAAIRRRVRKIIEYRSVVTFPVWCCVNYSRKIVIGWQNSDVWTRLRSSSSNSFISPSPKAQSDQHRPCPLHQALTTIPTSSNISLSVIWALERVAFCTTLLIKNVTFPISKPILIVVFFLFHNF